MEAYILLIKKEKLIITEDEQKVSANEKFSIWRTEKQAIINACKFLISETESMNYSSIYKQYALCATIKFLIESDKKQEAIDLVNECSKFYENENNYNNSAGRGAKYTIRIIPTAFNGSPFE